MERKEVLIPESPSPDSSGNPFLFFFKKEKIVTNSWKKLQIPTERQAPYSTFKITGRINWVFTGIPRLMAGFTFGKSTKRAFRILSIFMVS